MEAPGLLLEHKKWQQVDWNIKVIFFLQMQVNSVCLEPIPKTLSLIKSYMVLLYRVKILFLGIVQISVSGYENNYLNMNQ